MRIVGAVLELLQASLGLGPHSEAPDAAQASASTPARFVNYQIDVPRPSYPSPVASEVLLQHEFAGSWGRPHTVPYLAPSREFSHVELTLEVETFGTQYDRLAHLFLHGIEVWRPSTSEPHGRASTSAHTRDATAYLPLFRTDGELALELNNVVTDQLDGTFNVTLRADYFAGPPRSGGSSGEWYEHERAPPARVHPVLSAGIATGPVVAELPALPRNTTRAVLQVFASGNGNDEFWYAQSSLDAEDGKTGPLRHVVLHLAGEPAGVIAPFQQIYTGGFQPALWTPFVGVRAYDVPSYAVDVTPFLPDLWQGPAPLTLVVKDTHNRVVTHEWVLSAALLTWEDADVYGDGKRYTPRSTNHSANVLVPGTEVSTFSTKVNVTADLTFATSEQRRAVRVEWFQEHEVEGVLVGELVLAHSMHSGSFLSYHESSYSTEHTYDLGLVLNESSIAVVQSFHTSDFSAPDSLPALEPRNHSVLYNGSWSAYNTSAPRRDQLKFAEVTARLLDPWVPAADGSPTRHSVHAVSRNGSVISHGSDVDLDPRVLPETPPARKWFDTDASPEALERNRAIRHKWLRRHAEPLDYKQT